MAKKDLTGMRFGRLVVLCDDGTRDKHGKVMWKCRCDCRKIKYVRTDSLINKKTLSCGCLHKDKMKELWKDEEYRQMKSDKAKEQWKDEEYRQMKSDKTKEKWQDEEFREKQSDKMKELWQDEEMKRKMGYKGGITPISKYLRGLDVVKDWRIRAFIGADRCCEVSGKKVNSNNGEVHHIKPFCEIVEEAHTLNDIEIKEIVSDYSKEDLETLKAYIEEWHKDTTNAIVLDKNVHECFHNVFMKGKKRESSAKDIEEFKQRYLNGEFDKEN